jgi:hypothetical protein
LLPNLHYARLIVLAGIAMGLIAWLAPGPAVVVAVIAGAVYSAILLTVPGTINEVVRNLIPGLSRRSAAT